MKTPSRIMAEKRRFYGIAMFYGLACSFASVWFLYRDLFTFGMGAPILAQIVTFAGVGAAGLCFIKPQTGWYALLGIAFFGLLSTVANLNGPSLAANGFALTAIYLSPPPPQKISDRFNVDDL